MSLISAKTIIILGLLFYLANHITDGAVAQQTNLALPELIAGGTCAAGIWQSAPFIEVGGFYISSFIPGWEDVVIAGMLTALFYFAYAFLTNKKIKRRYLIILVVVFYFLERLFFLSLIYLSGPECINAMKTYDEVTGPVKPILLLIGVVLLIKYLPILWKTVSRGE